VNTDIRALHEQLKRDWCDAVEVEELADGSLTISTPFLFGDGDGYPLIVERRRGAWQLNDRGITVSRLIQVEELDFTETRRQQIEQFARANGFTFDAGTLSITLEQPPELEDVAAFIELLARVTGIPHHVMPERETEQFRTRARRHIITRWLPNPDLATENWEPPRPRGNLFKADLMLPAENGDVVAFFAASTNTANRSMAYVAQYGKWDLGVKPFLAHDGSLTSETIYRATLAFEDDRAVIPVEEEAAETGYLRLRRALADAGVPLN
jgi:hypothetical protein